MGACVSADRKEYDQPSTAKVITLKGDLHEYIVPVFVSQILQAESATCPNCFLCNSDGLLYDDYIPALSVHDQLHPDQIYFLLPNTKLQYKLSASDMAALAVKASLALQTAAKNGPRRFKKTRISPVLPVDKIEPSPLIKKSVPTDTNINISMTRSGSVRKLQRYTSRRAKLAVRSFRLRLSTIYEGIVV